MTIYIGGIQYKIDFFFVAIIVLASMGGLYYDIIGCILALCIHEAGHLICGHLMNLSVESVEILPFGGRITIGNLDQVSIETELVTILAGPMANFAFSFFLLFLLSQDMILPEMGQGIVRYQLMVGLFNMIPALPLDGGRVFMLWLRKNMNFINSIRIASKMGMFLAMTLCVIVIIGAFHNKYYFNMAIVSILVFFHSYKDYKEAPLLFMKQLVKKKENLNKRKYMQIESIVSVESTSVRDIVYLFSPQKYYMVYVLNERGETTKILTETEIFNKAIKEGLDIKMKDLL